MAGRPCRELVVEEYWHDGQVACPANVVWCHDGTGWHRLFFDCGVVFWRRSDRGPVAYDMPESHGRVALLDLGRSLGLAGRIIARVVTRPIDGGTEVVLGFDFGAVLHFRDVDDRTTVHYTG